MLTQKSRGWLTLDLTQIVARFPVPLAISVAFAIIANWRLRMPSICGRFARSDRARV